MVHAKRGHESAESTGMATQAWAMPPINLHVSDY